MRLIKKAWTNSGKQKIQRQFIILLSLLTLILYSYKTYQSNNDINFIVIVSIILITILLYLLSKIIKPILFVWLLIGLILGEISSFIILGIIYFVLFVPITLFIKLKNKKAFHTEAKWYNIKDKIIDYKRLY